ncbi:hypothetical protein [Aureimonas altamirensis]|uniref:hypothetical protein n=1 Tax=Aureimonas altamirensis TaxID=370622 RepID=UPI000AF91DD0|nr:hypothetical protein [Aureimonas altamirensis]
MNRVKVSRPFNGVIPVQRPVSLIGSRAPLMVAVSVVALNLAGLTAHLPPVQDAIPSQVVSAPTIPSSSVVHGPAVGQGDRLVAPPVVVSFSTVPAPVANAGPVALLPATISSASGVLSPVVSGAVAGIGPDAIISASLVHAPAVDRGAVSVAPVVVASVSDIAIPAVFAGPVMLTPGSISAASSIHPPVVVAVDGLNIVPDAIGTAAEVFDHTVLRGEVGISPEATSSTSTISEPSVLRGVLDIVPDEIASSTIVMGPTIAVGDVTVQPGTIPSVSSVPAVSVAAGAIAVEPSPIASASIIPGPTLDRGTVAIVPAAIASTSLVRTPVVGRGVRTIAPPAVSSTAVMFNPTVASEAPAGNWFDDPQWDRWQAIARGNDAAIWTGPKVAGKWPKRVATREEVLAIVASAGRGYMAEANGPYLYDSAANTVRVSNDRGRPQIVFDPYPRANILFPSGVFGSPQTVTIENFRHNLRFRGSGSLTLTGTPIPGGSMTLAGAGANVSVWTRFQPTGSGSITVTPTGDVRDVNLDARGSTFKEPDYPTIPIRTTTARVDQAAETINPGSLITPEIALNGTILLQGQLFAPPYNDTGGSGSRYLMGWEYDGRLEMQANGTIFCTAGGGNLSIPTGNTAADPFRVAVTFRERDVAGGYPADRPGICRMSVNGSAASSHEARYGSGLGDHAQLVFGRDVGSYQAQSAGAAGYDIIAFTSDLFTAAELAAVSGYQS